MTTVALVQLLALLCRLGQELRVHRMCHGHDQADVKLAFRRGSVGA
jgi:hypothetical protein